MDTGTQFYFRPPARTQMFDGDLDMRKLAMEAYRKSHPRTSHETKAWYPAVASSY